MKGAFKSSATQQYAVSKGFLIDSHKQAAYSYAEAIEYLRKYGLDKKQIKELESLPYVPVGADTVKIRDLIINGAISKTLDVNISENDANIVVPEHGEFDGVEFLSLARIAGALVVQDIDSNHIDDAQSLSFAILAMGLQFGQRKELGMQLEALGIMCRTIGLDKLNQCNRVLKDRFLQKTIDEMQIEFLKDKMLFEDKRWGKVQ
jgi:hypothetical protein